MTRYMLLLFAITFAMTVSGQNLKPVDQRSTVKFKIKNFGFNTVTGSFKGLQGSIRFSPENLPASAMDVSVDASTVNTGINARDNHLRKPDYFDVKKYPRIRIVSTKITSSSKAGTLFMFGKVTIKNVTREISFPFTAIAQDGGYLFTGEFRINRIDFGVGESSSVSDNVTVILNVFAGN